MVLLWLPKFFAMKFYNGVQPHYQRYIILYIILKSIFNSFLANNFCGLLITFANNLDLDLGRKNVSPEWIQTVQHSDMYERSF